MTAATVHLDLRGLACPLPVLKTRKALAGMPAGARLSVDTTDPLAKIDIPNLCRQDGHRLIEVTEEGGVFRLVIERG